ncbi:MAG: putative nucleotidyltransferase substrate binding domain-containing protein, partial [Acidimicrobiales bacterium]
ENLLERAMEAVDQPTSRARGALRQLVESETLRIAAADVLGIASLEETSRSLAALGDAALGAALLHAACPVPMALFALGRLGGRELSFGSDLDVLVVYDGRGPGDAAAAETAALSLLRFLNGETPAERILTVDSSLRPEGRQGLLARSLDAHAEYHSARLETWERQALLRLRPVAGDPPVIDAYVKLCDSAVWEQPFGEKEIRDLRRMKARVERERVPAGEDPQFHLKLGRGSLSDVEWTTQLLQLLNGIRQAGTLEAISALRAGGHLDEQSRAALAEAHRFLSLTRNRWHLVGNHVAGAGGIVTKLGSDSLPQQPSQLSRLARALSTTPSELREEYRRVTRRARRVTEERFYGL